MAAPPDRGPISSGEAARLFSDINLSSLLVAVSGGADSVALLWLLARWAGPEAGLRAVTVDHGLRPDSRREADEVATLAARLGIAHDVLVWTGDKPVTGIEAAAREARYALLAAHARDTGATQIATAHTRDDQAETVLMRLAAGSGPAGLAGMRSRNQRADGVLHLRPLLEVPKARLIATLLDAGIGWSEDPMNADPAFARARLRASAAVLAREGLTAERLAVLARRMARVEDALEIIVDAAWERHVGATGDGFVIDAAALTEPDEVVLRLLRRAISAISRGMPVRLDRLEALAEELVPAARRGEAAVRTLAGTRLATGHKGIRIAPAPPRRA